MSTEATCSVEEGFIHVVSYNLVTVNKQELGLTLVQKLCLKNPYSCS